MSKTIRLLPTITAALIALTLASAALAANSATAQAGGTIVAPLTLTKSGDLEFGCIVASGTSGTVKVSTGGSRSVTGGAALVSESPDAHGAQFDVTGVPDANFSVTLPGTCTVTRNSGSETMTVGTFRSSPSGTGSLEDDGTQSISVGAILAVGPGQVVGRYVGTFSVSINYD
jgi:hypothetical protein